ncbi:V-type proton ATPase subunit G [Teratosphaeria destructans]|uniref:V-type proton ATPase subunit G n=1 Tax=Teratosphaeria destructans TaxID=418781 RepID=A0A9W7SU16_9PEZI|nr:V-type proton ATPase subunit G [Teratosphaeria destructans]
MKETKKPSAKPKKSSKKPANASPLPPLPLPPPHLTPQNPDRTKRVKDARTEAQKEIDDYRQQKEDEFQKFEKEHTSGNRAAEEQAEKETKGQLEEIRAVGRKTGPKVVEDLVRAVLEVRPVVPDRVEGSETRA